MSATLEHWKWLAGDDTGISSCTIWGVMTGERPTRYRGGFRPDRPHDPDDFGRCYRLLQLFPEWRARLGEVAAAYPAWTELVAQWDDVERAFEAEVPDRRWGRAPATYALMQKIFSVRCLCGVRRLDDPELDEVHEVNACGGRRRAAGGGGRR